MKKSIIFGGFVLLTFVLRFHSFFRSVIDSDESLYLLMADALTRGHLPYTTVFDNKPPGVYFILAAGLKIFGGILSMRLMTLLFSAATACFIFEIALNLWKNALSGIFAGLFFCVFSVANGGVAANTEPFFIFFGVAGMLCALRKSESHAALLFGIAFQTKFLAAFDALASLAVPDRKSFKTAAAFALPTAVVAGVYLISGHWSEYWYSNFTANAIRAQITPLSLTEFFAGLRQQVLGFPLVWFTFFTAFFGVLFQLFKNPSVKFCLLWACFDLLAVFAMKRYYPHYYLQVLPPLCLLAGEGLAYSWKKSRSRNRVFAVGLTLVAVLSVFPVLWESMRLGAEFAQHRLIEHEKNWGDPAAKVADEVRTRLAPGQWPFVVNADPITYFLIDAKPPTPFLFPPFLTGESDLDRVAGVNGAAEIARLISMKPRLILFSPLWKGRDDILNAFSASLGQDYARVAEVEGVMIYQEIH